MKKISKYLVLSLMVFGVASCNTTQSTTQPTTKEKQTTQKGGQGKSSSSCSTCPEEPKCPNEQSCN